MKFTKTTWAAVGASLLLAACGGGGSGPLGSQNATPGPGELMQSPPPRITSLTADDYNARLSASATGQGLLTLSTGSPTGAVPCGVDVQYIKYGTLGGKGEATTATAALMVPTGTSPACSGARPIVLHAHGTAVERRYNMADFTDSTNPAYPESQVLAAIYAAQGFIVVAPNYAGYDASTLDYHPFLVASQQSKDMLDALVAAKAALPSLIAGTTTNGKVFLSGYSQGGYVALATHRAMITDPPTVNKLASLNLIVKASAPMSGPYALSAFGDQIIGGAVNASSTVLLPMLITGYQKTYGGLYTSTSDAYESAYSTGIESLFPGSLSYGNLIATGKVPSAALFSAASLPSAPTGQPLSSLWAAGFGSSNLIKDSYRQVLITDYNNNNLNPQHPLRIGAKTNDLTSMPQPVGATMFCGGSSDPTVYYATNTSAMLALPSWASSVGSAVSEVNMDLGDGTAVNGDPFGSLKTAFTNASTKVKTDAYTAAKTAGKTDNEAAAAAGAAFASTYHASVLPYCVSAARGFFSNPAF